MEDGVASTVEKRTQQIISKQCGGLTTFTSTTVTRDGSTTITTTFSSSAIPGKIKEDSTIFSEIEAIRLAAEKAMALSRKQPAEDKTDTPSKKHRIDQSTGAEESKIGPEEMTAAPMAEEEIPSRPVRSRGKKRRVGSESKSLEKPLKERVASVVTPAILEPSQEMKELVLQEAVEVSGSFPDKIDVENSKKPHIEQSIAEPQLEKSVVEDKGVETSKKRSVDALIQQPEAKKSATEEVISEKLKNIEKSDVKSAVSAAVVEEGSESEKADKAQHVSRKRALKASLSEREIKYQREGSPPPSPEPARKFFLSVQRNVDELTDKIAFSMPGIERKDIQVFARFLNASSDKKDILDVLEKGNIEYSKQALKHALLKAISYSTSDANVEVYSRILKSIDPLPKYTPEVVSSKHIAIVFGDSFAKKSGFEGDYDGTPYGRLVVDFLKSKDRPNPELQKIIENAIALHSFSGTDSASLKESIKMRFDSGQKKCLLYGGWADHSITYEIEKQSDGRYAFRVFNEGSGVDFHKSSLTGYREKYDGCLSVKDIPEHLLFKSELLGCIQGLLHIKSKDTPSPGELLARHIFPMLDGNKDIVPADVQQMLSPQRSGTCIYRSLQTFIANQLTQKEYKLFKCRFKNFLLNKYLPTLQRASGKKIETVEEYSSCRQDYAAIKRSVEKYAASIEKIALGLPPEEVQKLETTLLEYKAALIEFKKRIIDFEKSFYPPTQLTETRHASVICKIPEFKPAKTVSEAETAWDSSLSGTFKGRALCLLKDIANLKPGDSNFSLQVENIINELATLPYEEASSIYTSQSIYLFDLLCRKLGGIEGWGKLNFANATKAVQSFNKIVRSLASQTDKNTSAELHGMFLSFSLGLEAAFKQWNKESKMLVDTFPRILSCVPSIEKMQSSDPFWRDQLVKLSGIIDLEVWTNVSYSKKQLDSAQGMFIPKMTLASAIGKWLDQPEQAALRKEIQESVKNDRQKMNQIVVEQTIRDKKRIEELTKVKNIGSRVDQEKIIQEIEKCQIRIESGVTRLKNTAEFWPFGFLEGESPRLSSEYKGLFLLSRGEFFKKKLGREDLLPREFRNFLDTGVLVYNILSQEKRLFQADMPVFPKEFDAPQGRWPINEKDIKFVYTKSPLYNNELIPADQYLDSLKDPSIQKLYLTVSEISSKKSAAKYGDDSIHPIPETFIHLAAEEVAKEGKIGIDECKDIISITATPEVQIHSLINYCSKHKDKLLDNEYFNIFHSILFSSDHLLRDLRNDKAAALLIDTMRSLFTRVVEESLKLRDYATCANILWLAGNVQKYIDYPVDRKQLPLVPDVIYEELFQAATDPKNIDAVPVIMESILASSEKILSSPPKTADEKKLFSRACIAYAVKQRYPIVSDQYCLPRQQQADKAILKLQHTLSLEGVEERNLIDEAYISSSLGKFFPPFSGSTLVWDTSVCYLQQSGKTIGNFSISLGQLQPTDPKMLRIFDNPVPEAIQKLLKQQNLFPEGHEYKKMRCYFEGGICYIYDKKTDKCLQIAISDEGSFDIYVRIKTAQTSTWAKFIPLQKREYTEQFLDLKTGYHHIQLGDEIFLCSAGFKPEYQVTSAGTIHPVEKSKLHVVEPPAVSVFNSFEDSKCTTYLADDKNHLQEIRFPRMGMTIEQAKGKWLLKGQPDWFLAKEQFLPHFGPDTGFLIFENAKGEKKTYLPLFGPGPIKSGKDAASSPTRSLHFPYSYDFEAKDKRRATCVECRIEGGVIIPATVEARYQLGRIYLEKGYFEEVEELFSLQKHL